MSQSICIPLTINLSKMEIIETLALIDFIHTNYAGQHPLCPDQHQHWRKETLDQSLCHWLRERIAHPRISLATEV